MKKNVQKKLVLSRETLHLLDKSALQRAAGGASEGGCGGPTYEYPCTDFTC